MRAPRGEFEKSMNKQNELFRKIHTQNYSLLHMLARKKGIPLDDVEDMIQEVFLSYYEHYPLTWEGTQIRFMLAKILQNRCMDYWRISEKRELLCIDSEEPGEAASRIMLITEEDNLTILVKREEIRETLHALDTMKPEWAEVIRLRILEDRPMTEVSEMLGISDNLVRTRLTRGRRYLREMLGKERK